MNLFLCSWHVNSAETFSVNIAESVMVEYGHKPGISTIAMQRCTPLLEGIASMGQLNYCASSELGVRLLLAAKYETVMLNPPHTYVPW